MSSPQAQRAPFRCRSPPAFVTNTPYHSIEISLYRKDVEWCDNRESRWRVRHADYDAATVGRAKLLRALQYFSSTRGATNLVVMMSWHENRRDIIAFMSFDRRPSKKCPRRHGPAFASGRSCTDAGHLPYSGTAPKVSSSRAVVPAQLRRSATGQYPRPGIAVISAARGSVNACRVRP